LDIVPGDKVQLIVAPKGGGSENMSRVTMLTPAGKPLPLEMQGQIIYYVGPSPAKPGRPVGAAGPTTSYRMDAYAPELMRLGLKGMIGKGARNQDVKDAMATFKAVYFAAIGGAGALMAQTIKDAEIIAYEDLGPEAIRRLEVVEFPVIVVNDVRGNDLYEEGVKRYAL
jgi:fumarate hydratase subunit beta